MVTPIKGYDAPSRTLVELDSALATIGRIKSAVEDVYERRVQASSNRVERWIIAHPKRAQVVGVGGGLATVFAGACAFAHPVLVPLESMPMEMAVGWFTTGAVLMLGGLIAAGLSADNIDKVGPHKRRAGVAIEHTELAGLQRELREMTDEQRESVRDYIQNWTDANSDKFGPAVKHDLRWLVSFAATDTVGARAGQAASIVADASSGVAFSVLEPRIVALLERTPSNERADVAEALRRRLFDGDHCRIADTTSSQKHELYERLTSFNTVTIPAKLDAA